MTGISSHFFSIQDMGDFLLKWGPRTIVAGLAGYTSLGFAYDIGLMAAIDRVAIKVFKHFAGYTGIGAFMPVFQWYAAWTIRALSAIIAGVLYDLVEKVVKYVLHKIGIMPPLVAQAV